MIRLDHFDDAPGLPRLPGLLLKALLAEDGEGSQQALQTWSDEVDFDMLDYSSFRLVPALYAKFAADPACAQHVQRMKGIYRYFLYRNSLIVSQGHQTVAALRNAGIELVLFKGITLALDYYDSPALRPMGDIDVLVRRDDVALAEQVLSKLGWHYRYDATRKRQDIHSHDYINASKNGFDLHWHVLSETPFDGIDAGIRERAESSDWNGIEVKRMAAEDLALVAMANGLRDQRHEWILDVDRLIRARPDFDWSILWREADRRQLQPKLHDAIRQYGLTTRRETIEVILDRWFDADPDWLKSRLECLIKENRTHAIHADSRATAKSLIETGQAWTRLPKRILGLPDTTYARWLQDRSRAKHVRYRTNAAGDVESIYLYAHSALPDNLFINIDQEWLRRARTTLGNEGEGWVSAKPGSLKPRPSALLPDYRARIDLIDCPVEITCSPESHLTVSVTVSNLSRHFWHVPEESPSCFGVSYHLYDTGGQLLGWDHPRNYFLPSRPSTIVYAAPGQRITCQVVIRIPETPGQYLIRFDVVHEMITWFSSWGNRFPEIKLTVAASV
jgi:hypothetical protein